MDDRQTQIRSGAGLEESRLNEEFIDFLKKWSTPVLWLIVIIGAAWWGLRYLEQQRVAERDNAFASLNEALSGGNPSPSSLRTIADTFDGVGSVSELALLQAVDIYLRAAISGVEPGAEIDPVTGLATNEADVLDASQVTSYLGQALEISRGVADATAGVAGKELLSYQAFMRLAAAQEGLASIDEAKSSYERAADAARAGGYTALAQLAETRGASADAVASAGELPSRDAMKPLPGEEALDSPVTLPGVSGQTSDLEVPDSGLDAGDREAESEPAGSPESTSEPESDPASGAPDTP
ncbi:MAG: hypothetical protein AAGA55_01590 [Planctomycetota bacterium]